jgi:rhamnosyltransferase subunit B
MRVLLAPFGSRGDVAPLLALGQALRARGHTVLAAVPENSASWARRLGFAVAPGIPDFRACFDGTHSEWTVLRRAMARVGANYAALESAARGADWIVASMMQFAAASVAEQTGAGYAYVATSPPYLRNRSLPLLMLPFRRTPRFLQDAQWCWRTMRRRSSTPRSTGNGRSAACRRWGASTTMSSNRVASSSPPTRRSPPFRTTCARSPAARST